jgi:hypothetical protein
VKKRGLFFLVTGCLFLFSLETAFAYIPPASFILKTLSAKRVGLKQFKVKTRLKFSTPVTEVTWVDFSKRVLKSKVYDDAQKELYRYEKKFSDLSIVGAILFEDQVEALIKKLSQNGIALPPEDGPLPERTGSALSFGRWRGVITWILGESTDNQLWVEKDSFLPVHLLSKKIEKQDVSFSNYKFYEKLPYPRLMEKKEGDEISPEAVDGALSFRPKEFDFSDVAGWTDEGSKLDSSTKNLIEKYYLFFR